MGSPTQPGPVVIQDTQSCLPLSKGLSKNDLILLLTPAVAARPQNDYGPNGAPIDPFEPLGRALARHHDRIRHVPYLPRNGITQTHAVHIKLAANIIFVISGPAVKGQPSQLELAEAARTILESKPQIIIACCNVKELAPLETSFATIIQIPSYSPAELQAAAELLFRDPSRTPARASNLHSLILPPSQWGVEVWQAEKDQFEVTELWNLSLPDKFRLGHFRLYSLLRRDGYAMHYVVRDPETRQILGFCATYTTYVDSGLERLIGSLAAIIVRPSYRGRGVGRSLHDHAQRQLLKTRGVYRLQLGSTFPRLLYGLPLDLPTEEWFRRRGWRTNLQIPGMGQEACDWLLRFEDWPLAGVLSSEIQFRPCEFDEFETVLKIVDRESRKKDCVGWFDQYAKLANTMNVRDIIVAIEGGTIVATALTYMRNTGSAVFDDLPWGNTISDDVGGVTCICIRDDHEAVGTKRDAIMIRLLDSCIRILAEQGMRKLFIDAVKGGDEGFQSMGFQKWAQYREVWQEA
ncbi:hypothetical protein GQ53DRAFT_667793 [Thozetella sp. PMI_491]|nr:hypothetical protein GQ53DRAFT_667793 [Thozetella sp. PMI_491]